MNRQQAAELQPGTMLSWRRPLDPRTVKPGTRRALVFRADFIEHAPRGVLVVRVFDGSGATTVRRVRASSVELNRGSST